jgi:BlaI family transcriptional regulator, penicillinase repressor
MAKSEFIKPTEGELEILQLLWERKKASVREIHTELEKVKGSGYTTTLKLMQIMFEKGLVNRDGSSRSHIYTAALPQQTAQKHMMGKMISTLYAGSAAQMVMQVLGTNKVSREELNQIEEFLKTIK